MLKEPLINKKRLIALILGCVLTACSLISCKGIEITGKTEDVEEYTLPELMLVLGSERNRYQRLLGADLWSISPGEEQETYGDYFVRRTREFLQEVKTLNLLAAEKGIIVSPRELEQIRRLSTSFYEGLSDADKAFFADCSIKDVGKMYTEYFLAEKTAEYLLGAVDAEVSDADAKVIEIQQIVVSDADKAADLLERVHGEGANFAYYARQYSEESVYERALARGEEENILYSTAFSLEEGEISEIIAMDGSYYIIKCIDAYNRQATSDRKQIMQHYIRERALGESYNEYAEQHIVRFRADYWQNIDLSAYPESTADNFFSLYEESGL